jgi:hypothetical protein
LVDEPDLRLNEDRKETSQQVHQKIFIPKDIRKRKTYIGKE